MTLSQRITSQTLADQAFDKLVSAIVRGELAPGARISEVVVAQRLGISRGPLREALSRLEGKLVERTARVGVRVIALSRQDLAEHFVMREALEGMAARLAATAMSDASLASLRTLLDSHRPRTSKRGAGYYQHGADDDFHLRIARGSGNRKLAAYLSDELYQPIRIYRFRSSLTRGRAQAAFEEHGAILAALVARDPDRAETEMRRHIANARANLQWAEDGIPRSELA
jgi:DNA-binding GntR family transcriptional regulator